MNLFLHSLEGTIEGFFFENNGKKYQEISIPKQSGIIDELSKYKEIKEIQNIFIVSGPASFTSLRNLAVFTNTFLKFSDQEINFFSIPTLDIFKIFFPDAKEFFLSVGKRETFLFSPQSEIKYTKWKNMAIAEKINQSSKSKELRGFLSPEMKQLIEGNFSEAIPLFKTNTEKFFIDLLALSKEKKWEKEFLEIEYGALPNIG